MTSRRPPTEGDYLHDELTRAGATVQWCMPHDGHRRMTIGRRPTGDSWLCLYAAPNTRAMVIVDSELDGLAYLYLTAPAQDSAQGKLRLALEHLGLEVPDDED